MAEPSFEEAMKRIEQIVADLEKSDIPLEEALKPLRGGGQAGEDLPPQAGPGPEAGLQAGRHRRRRICA